MFGQAWRPIAPVAEWPEGRIDYADAIAFLATLRSSHDDPELLVNETDFTSTSWAWTRSYWPDLFGPDELDLTGKPGLRFLEVGCFEGHATLWLLENVLTDPSSEMVVVDPFDVTRGEKTNFQRFVRNVSPHIHRVCIYTGRSETYLPHLSRSSYDFVYIDGSHLAADVLSDAVLAWRLLRPGGVIVFDDYDWPDKPAWEVPAAAVDAFVTCYEPQVAEHGPRLAQYVVRKEVT